MIKLKRSLFIGLGGTGAAAILNAKKKFIDAYGEVPPMISFLVIDTDGDTGNKYVESNKGEHIKLKANEFLYTKVQNPQSPLKRYRNTLFSWVPDDNIALAQKMTHGAGQIRSNGRFALHFNHTQIANSVNDKLSKILNAQNLANKRFQVNGNDVEISFAFSVGGGTGSGTFIDIAYIVNDTIQTFGANIMFKKIGFLVLPDIFHLMQAGPAMKNVFPNAYGALKDLDYLMHLDGTKSLNIKYENKEIDVNNQPFDIVFTVNNKNSDGHVYSNIDEIGELIGLAMYTGASELSGTVNSSYDNVSTVLASGQMRVGGKEAWACGFGLSELVFDGEQLSKIYSRKVVINLVEDLLSADHNLRGDFADLFVDKPSVQIRENNNYDHVIDSLLSDRPDSGLSYIQESSSAGNEVDSFIQADSESSKKILATNYQNKLRDVQFELHKYLIELINSKGGIASAEKFFQGLVTLISIFEEEMKQEEQEFDSQIPSIEGQVRDYSSELSSLSSGIGKWLKSSHITSVTEDLIESVNNLVVYKREKLRRTEAIKFYKELRENVEKYQNKVVELKRRLEKIKNDLSTETLSLQNLVNKKPKSFVIDLHNSYLLDISVDQNDYSVNAFVDHLEGNKVYDFHGIDEEIIRDKLLHYSSSLPKTQQYAEMSIDDALADLPEDELMSVTSLLVEKSIPLWAYDFYGEVVSPDLHSAFVVGVPSKDNSIFTNKNVVENVVRSEVPITYTGTNSKDRIILYRMESSVPIYAVKDMKGYEQKYNVSPVDHHIDSNWTLKMEREDFKIYPSMVEDNSLETWVLGFIFDLISFREDTYMVKSEDKGDQLDDYWSPLDEYRDQAFTEFKKQGFVKEIQKKLELLSNKIGQDDLLKLIEDVTSEKNYIEKYSKMNLSIKDLKTREFEPIAALFKQEIDFVKKKLAEKFDKS